MIVFAHRGFSGIAPENTLSAFRKALDVGADGIECDVHLSRDGQIVVCHDHTLERTTNGTGMICDYTWDELQKFDAGGWFSEEYRGERIPLFEELVDLVDDSDIILNIELKTDKVSYPLIEEKVLDLLVRHDLVERSYISSFHFESLEKVKTLCPDLKTGALYKRASDIDDFWGRVAHLGVDALHPCYLDLTPEFVAQAKERGLVINTWTVNEVADIENMIRLGVDGVIGNYPDRAKQIVSRCCP